MTPQEILERVFQDQLPSETINEIIDVLELDYVIVPKVVQEIGWTQDSYGNRSITVDNKTIYIGHEPLKWNRLTGDPE